MLQTQSPLVDLQITYGNIIKEFKAYLARAFRAKASQARASRARAPRAVASRA